MLVITKKSYVVQVDTVRSYSDFTEGSMDLKQNFQVGTHTHGGVILDLLVTQTIMEVSIRMERALLNEFSGMITTTYCLIAPVMDRGKMDTQDGTY
jgi:hypothetical protein